jgi:hypothetical protein
MRAMLNVRTSRTCRADIRAILKNHASSDGFNSGTLGRVEP